MTRPRFAFLALKGHPYASMMLAELLGAGFQPEIVVEEESSVAVQGRAKFLERMEGHALPASVAAQCAAARVTLTGMPLHKSDALMELLGETPLDLIVLGGTRIVRGAILSHPAHGVINSHPGLLPDCRGSASPAWSVFHDIPIGSTTHFCDEGIDTGDLLLRRALPVQRGMTYEDLCFETAALSAVLMKEALQAFDDGRWQELRHAQGVSPWPTFKNAPPEVLEEVQRKLREETSVHYAS
jgi:methionyl-tRNA formyltransferase